jgi:hypothetical protein
MEQVKEIFEVIESLEATEDGVDALASVQAGETWA